MIQKSWDNILLTLAFLLLLFSGHHLFFKSHLTNSQWQGQVLGHLDKPSKTVKYKDHQSFSWRDAIVGMPLQDGDRLYTHNEAEAKIAFIKGPKLLMNPNTLLVIKSVGEGQGLDLQSGNITALLEKGNDHITLVLGQRTFRLSSQKARIKISQKGDQAQVSVLSGQVKLEEVHKDSSKGSKTQASQDIGPATFKLTKETQISQSDAQSSLELTRHSLSFKRSSLPLKQEMFPEGEISFEWENPNEKESSPYFFELAKDSDFKEVIYTRQTSDLTHTVSFKEEGHYYFRVRTNDSQSPTEEIKVAFFLQPEFQLLNKSLIEGTTESLQFEIPQRNYPQILSIEQNQLVLEEKLIPASSQELLNIKLTQKLGGSPLKVHLKAKDYDPFNIQKSYKPQKAIKLEAPALMAPQSSYTLYSFQPETTVQLQWSLVGQEQASEFMVHVEKPQGQTIHKIVEAPPFPFKTAKEGVYQWKIKAKRGPSESEFSEERTFELVLKKPLEKFPLQGTEVELKRPDQEVAFHWKKEALKNEAYLIEVSNSPDFKNPTIRQKTRNTFKKIRFPKVGTYYWRTRIIDQEGKLRLGSPEKVIVKPAPPPEPLKLEEKIELELQKRSSSFNQGSTFISKPLVLWSLLKKLIDEVRAQEEKEADTFIKLTWPASDQAKSYLLKIYSEENEEEALVEVEVDENQFEWVGAKPGNYYWKVAIKDFWERLGDFSNKSVLVIKAPLEAPLTIAQKKAPEIDLIAPPHRFMIKPSQKYMTFRFSLPALTKSGELLMSPNLSFNKPFFKKKLQSTKKGIHKIKIPLSSIKENYKGDSFYWRVRAKVEKKVTKSLRRSLIFTTPKEREKKSSLATTLDPSYLIPSSPRFYQKLSLVSFDQENNAYDAETSGIFVAAFGVDWRPESFNQRLDLSGDFGRAKTFNEAYYQGQAQAVYNPEYLSSLSFSWLSLGVKAQLQTSFVEINNTRLTSEQNILFQGVLECQFSLPFGLRQHELKATLGLGQGLSYRGSWLIPMTTLNVYGKSRWLALGLFFEGLSYEEGTSEISTTSFGTTWSLSF